MSETIAIEVEVDGKKAGQTLGGLKKEFESLNAQIENVDVNSKEFKKLQAQIVKTGGKVKNLELSMESLNSEGVASAVGGLAGGIGGVTSALVLMGGENETVKEMTENIQLAMAISMGLKGAIEGASFGYKLFNNVLKTNAVVMRLAGMGASFFGKALIATGIGAIVVGLGLLVANFDSVSKYAKKAGDYMYKFFKPQIDLVISALQYLGIIETENEKIVREAQESIIKSYGDRAEALKNLKDEIISTYDAELRGINRQIALAKAQGKNTSQLEEERMKIKIQSSLKETQLTANRIASLMQELEVKKLSGKFDKEKLDELQKSIDKEIDIQAKAQIKFQDSENNLKVFYESERTENRRKYKEHNEKKLAEQKAFNEKLKEEEKASQDEVFQQFLDTLKKEEEEKKLWADGLREEKLIIDEETELEDWQIEEQRLDKLNQLKKQKEAEDLENKKKAQKKRDDLINNGLANASKSLTMLSDLNTAILNKDLANAGNNENLKEKLRKESFEREKKMNIAKALINGAQAVMIALASSPPPLSYILAAGTGVMTALQVNAIKKTKYSGGSSSIPSLGSSASAGGSAGGGVNINPVSNTSTTIGDQKVFVTESDITSTQNSVEAIEKQSTF